MVEGRKYQIQNEPIYTIKGRLAVGGEWLSVTLISDPRLGTLQTINLQVVGVRYSDKAVDGSSKSSKLVYFKNSKGAGLVFHEERVLSVSDVKLAPALVKLLRA